MTNNIVLPQVEVLSSTPEGTNLKLTIPTDLLYFAGHFPAMPILAGVVQLDWAIHFASVYLNLQDLPVQEVQVLKYQNVIEPGTVIELSLVQKSENKFTFHFYSDDDKNHASGRILLGEGE